MNNNKNKTMKTSIESITPELASKYLKANNNNRKISQSHLDYLIYQMNNNLWRFNGDPIRFNTSGKLLDGQHRLAALVKSNKTFDFLIIKDLDDDVFDVIDTGKNRRACEVLYIAGHNYAVLKSSIAKGVIDYRRNNLRTRRKVVTNSEILKFVNLNTRLEDVCRLSDKYNQKFKILTKKSIGFLYFLFSEKDPYLAESFFTKLCYGNDLSDNDMIYKLRLRLINDSVSEKTKRMPLIYKHAMVVKTWNLIRQHKTVKVIKFSETEPFPEII